MKKFLLATAILATILTSCDTNSKDSYSTINFVEYNLITNLEDDAAPAQASSAVYNMKINYSKNCVDLRESGLSIDDRKITFETDTMALTTSYLVSSNGSDYITQGHFSKKSNVGVGENITDMNATFTPGVYNITSIYIPELESTAYSFGNRLLMSYNIGDKYHVQTFWPICYYAGKSYVSGNGSNYSTYNTSYRVDLNLDKNTAKVVVLYPEFSTENAEVPQAILLENIPVAMTHDSYYLYAESPKTRVLGKKDNTVAFVDSDNFNVSNFSMRIVSADLTEASFNYRIDNYLVNFEGCSVVKASK